MKSPGTCWEATFEYAKNNKTPGIPKPWNKYEKILVRQFFAFRKMFRNLANWD
jgi:hypothetical protein